VYLVFIIFTLRIHYWQQGDRFPPAVQRGASHRRPPFRVSFSSLCWSLRVLLRIVFLYFFFYNVVVVFIIYVFSIFVFVIVTPPPKKKPKTLNYVLKM
jgi:predicted membrane metal-binding protein